MQWLFQEYQISKGTNIKGAKFNSALLCWIRIHIFCSFKFVSINVVPQIRKAFLVVCRFACALFFLASRNNGAAAAAAASIFFLVECLRYMGNHWDHNLLFILLIFLSINGLNKRPILPCWPILGDPTLIASLKESMTVGPSVYLWQKGSKNASISWQNLFTLINS